LAVGGKTIEEDVGSGIVGLALLADDAGDAREESEEVERGVLGERCGVEIPSAFYFAADCFVELTDCHGCVDFVLVM
jgi:hypothetical protein